MWFFSSWSFVHLCNGIEYGPCIEYVDDPPPLRNCSKLQNEGKVWEDSALLRGGWIIIGCLSLVGFTSLEVVKPIKSFKVMQRATKSQRPRGFSKLLIHSAEFSCCSFLHNFYNTIVNVAYDRKNLRCQTQCFWMCTFVQTESWIFAWIWCLDLVGNLV